MQLEVLNDASLMHLSSLHQECCSMNWVPLNPSYINLAYTAQVSSTCHKRRVMKLFHPQVAHHLMLALLLLGYTYNNTLTHISMVQAIDSFPECHECMVST